MKFNVIVYSLDKEHLYVAVNVDFNTVAEHLENVIADRTAVLIRSATAGSTIIFNAEHISIVLSDLSN